MSPDPFRYAQVNIVGMEPFPVPFPDDAHYVVVSHIRGCAGGPEGFAAQMTLLHCTRAEFDARPDNFDPTDPASYTGLPSLSILLMDDDAASIIVGLVTAFEYGGCGRSFQALLDRKLAAARQMYRAARGQAG